MSPKKKKGKQVVMEPEFSDTPEKDPPPDQSRERVSAYDSMEVDDDLEGLDQTNQEMRIKAIKKQFALLKQRAIEADLKEASLREQARELEKKEERLKERQMKIEASLIERMSALEQKENESDLKRSLEADVMSLVLQMQSEEVVVAQERLLAQQTAETERMRREAEVMETSLKQLEARENELSLGVVKTKVDGFDDAKEAGGENAKYCTLILTEGLSAASFVVLDVFPEDKRRRFGVFALQGKTLVWFECQNASLNTSPQAHMKFSNQLSQIRIDPMQTHSFQIGCFSSSYLFEVEPCFT